MGHTCIEQSQDVMSSSHAHKLGTGGGALGKALQRWVSGPDRYTSIPCMWRAGDDHGAVTNAGNCLDGDASSVPGRVLRHHCIYSIGSYNLPYAHSHTEQLIDFDLQMCVPEPRNGHRISSYSSAYTVFCYNPSMAKKLPSTDSRELASGLKIPQHPGLSSAHRYSSA